jgi:hypothetical protein
MQNDLHYNSHHLINPKWSGAYIVKKEQGNRL